MSQLSKGKALRTASRISYLSGQLTARTGIHIWKPKSVTFTDDLPPEGPSHTKALSITVHCNNHRVPFVLVDNGSGVNVCPLNTAKAICITPDDFSFSKDTVRAVHGFDNGER
ncbi:hypothetical protein Sjap_026668 [Stephania japonica]|uniref:Uncharacterized protein n=1 Tax=Stephania japonica TaxID=461633 RepID=A0AAP0DUQ4_9MAGN